MKRSPRAIAATVVDSLAKGRRVTLCMANFSRLAKERRNPPLLQTRPQSDAAFVIPQSPEWQRIRDQIDTAMIFTGPDFINMHRKP